MNNKVKISAAAVMLACATALVSLPATAAVHPAKATCMDIKWNVELLKNYPRAPTACQEIVVRDGKKYARFEANVITVTPDRVTVRFLNVVGHEGRELAIKPGPGATVEIAGKKVEYANLKKGDKLTFMVPEEQLGVISDPDETAASEIIVKK